MDVLGVFHAQVTQGVFSNDVFYAIATVCLFLLVVAVGLIDAGLVQRKNVLDTWIQKLIAAMIAGLGMAVIGFAIWEWQYYQAFAIHTPLSQAISDWWIGGTNATTFPQNLDPAIAPTNDEFQVFLVFFVAFAMVGGALLHSAGLERVKALPMFIIAGVAGTIVMPLLLYYTWGSVSPLTRNGTHDYLGVYSLYILVGVWALLIAWRAGPRLGVFSGSQRAPEPGGPPGTGVLAHRPHNLGLTAAGVGLALFCVPFLALGCGYIVPGAGYFGIALTTSGFGVVLENIFMAFMGGAITGAVISYLTKNPIMALLGPVAGYIGGAASFDIVKPLGAFAIALIAPLVVYGVYLLLDRMRIDDKKIVPLTLGGGVYAVIAAGIAGSGTATGGYFGLKGAYAFQVSTVTLGHQLLGLVVTLGIALISGVIVIVGLEKTIGLRVSQEAEIAGLDHSLWGSAPGDVVVVETPAEEPGLGVPTSRPASAVQPAPGTSG